MSAICNLQLAEYVHVFCKNPAQKSLELCCSVSRRES